ncbi:MAG: DUF177 domain-containing protein [Chloroflexi bacterium]|nr:DUF177 domain-containing protein [Chloroflexota bacterium]
MQLHVLQDLRRKLGSVSECELEEERVVAGDLVLHDLRGTVSLLRTDRGLLATMDATAKREESCSRCLAGVLVDVDVRFQEEYVPLVDADTGARIYLDEDDEAFSIDSEFWLDLREGLRQYILMSEPLKPLCRDDCAGLCPLCGADLNAGRCKCQPETDERWDALAGLKQKMDEGK